jgi:hypothetical protein
VHCRSAQGLEFRTVAGWVAVLRLEVLEALRHLFRRTWFSRVWIVQEIVLAKDVAVICGRYSLPGADIAKEFKHHVSSSTATVACKIGFPLSRLLGFSRSDLCPHAIPEIIRR